MDEGGGAKFRGGATGVEAHAGAVADGGAAAPATALQHRPQHWPPPQQQQQQQQEPQQLLLRVSALFSAPLGLATGEVLSGAVSRCGRGGGRSTSKCSDSSISRSPASWYRVELLELEAALGPAGASVQLECWAGTRLHLVEQLFAGDARDSAARVLHFCGGCDSEGGLLLENDSGSFQFVERSLLLRTLRLPEGAVVSPTRRASVSSSPRQSAAPRARQGSAGGGHGREVPWVFVSAHGPFGDKAAETFLAVGAPGVVLLQHSADELRFVRAFYAALLDRLPWSPTTERALQDAFDTARAAAPRAGARLVRAVPPGSPTRGGGGAAATLAVPSPPPLLLPPSIETQAQLPRPPAHQPVQAAQRQRAHHGPQETRWSRAKRCNRAPQPPPHFVGRAAELRKVCDRLFNPSAAGSGRPLVVLSGRGGSGKTALARHAAAFAAERGLVRAVSHLDCSMVPPPPEPDERVRNMVWLAQLLAAALSSQHAGEGRWCLLEHFSEDLAAGSSAEMAGRPGSGSGSGGGSGGAWPAAVETGRYEQPSLALITARARTLAASGRTEDFVSRLVRVAQVGLARAVGSGGGSSGGSQVVSFAAVASGAVNVSSTSGRERILLVVDACERVATANRDFVKLLCRLVEDASTRLTVLCCTQHFLPFAAASVAEEQNVKLDAMQREDSQLLLALLLRAEQAAHEPSPRSGAARLAHEPSAPRSPRLEPRRESEGVALEVTTSLDLLPSMVEQLATLLCLPGPAAVSRDQCVEHVRRGALERALSDVEALLLLQQCDPEAARGGRELWRRCVELDGRGDDLSHVSSPVFARCLQEHFGARGDKAARLRPLSEQTCKSVLLTLRDVTPLATLPGGGDGVMLSLFCLRFWPWWVGVLRAIPRLGEARAPLVAEPLTAWAGPVAPASPDAACGLWACRLQSSAQDPVLPLFWMDSRDGAVARLRGLRPGVFTVRFSQTCRSAVAIEYVPQPQGSEVGSLLVRVDPATGAAVAAGGGQRFASLADLILQRPELEKAYAPARNVRKSLIFAPRGAAAGAK